MLPHLLSTHVHNSALLPAQEDKVGVWHFRVRRKEMRPGIQFAEFSENTRMAITPAHVPGLLSGTTHLRPRFWHRENLVKGHEIRFEVQKLTVFVDTLQGARRLQVQVLQVRVIEQRDCWPMRNGVLNYNRSRGVGVRLETKEREFNWDYNPSLHNRSIFGQQQLEK